MLEQGCKGLYLNRANGDVWLCNNIDKCRFKEKGICNYNKPIIDEEEDFKIIENGLNSVLLKNCSVPDRRSERVDSRMAHKLQRSFNIYYTDTLRSIINFIDIKLQKPEEEKRVFFLFENGNIEIGWFSQWIEDRAYTLNLNLLVACENTRTITHWAEIPEGL